MDGWIERQEVWWMEWQIDGSIGERGGRRWLEGWMVGSIGGRAGRLGAQAFFFMQNGDAITIHAGMW